MNDQTELPAEVIAELQANRKVNAIKLLREHQGIGLKEAKAFVDDYMSRHPSDTSHQLRQPLGGVGRLVFVALVAGLVSYLYRSFA